MSNNQSDSIRDLEQFDGLNPFAPWRFTGSIITTIANWTINILTIISLIPPIDCCLNKHNKFDMNNLLPRDIQVIIVVTLPTILFFFFRPSMSIKIYIAAFCLLNIFSAVLRDIFVAPQNSGDKDGEYIIVRDRLRWLEISFLQAYSIIISFAIMLLYYGDQFNPRIEDRITSLYQSTLTFTTLGFGDISPLCGTGKFLVISELVFF